jgi:transposase
VIEIETETDVRLLRQVALLQEREIERLHRRIGELVGALAKAQGQDATAALQLELLQLQEQLAVQRKALFGRSSERRTSPSPSDAQRSPQAKTGHGPRPQTELPRVEVLHTLDPADQLCTACGGTLREMTGQFEESEEVDVVERSFRIVRHKRQKYRCACGGCIETALGPPKLVPGGRYSVDFAVAVAVAKYVDHLPLARQVRQMARAGLTVDTQTLWDQLQALHRHLLPTYEALHAHTLGFPVVGADETVWPLLEKGGSKRWYAWSIATPDAVFYRVDASRSAEAARALLRDYAGIVVCDGYSAYQTLASAREGPRFTLAHCWSHVRRKFVEAEPAYPQAKELLALIGELFKVEAQAREADVPDRRALLLSLRDQQSRPIVLAIHEWLTRQIVLPQSSLGKAIAYALELWPGLVRFLEDPDIPIDNNATERAIRGVVLGRKNHYGSKSLRGTQVAALFYSLVESAKLVGLEPAAYLAQATRRAIANPGTVTLPRDLTRS